LLIAVKEAIIIAGMVTGYGVIYACDGNVDEQTTWRVSWCIPAPFALTVIYIMYYAPPSPRWLVLWHRSDEAREALRAIWPHRTDEDLAQEVTDIEHSLEGFDDAEGDADVTADGVEGAGAPSSKATEEPDGQQQQQQQQASEGVMAQLKKVLGFPCSAPEKRKWARLGTAAGALVGGLGLVFFQQLTGQPTVLYYAQTIFINAGFTLEEAKSSDLIVGGSKFAATLVSVPLVDRLGRKPLLFFGISIMCVALMLLAIGFAVGWQGPVLGALILFVCGYQFSFGPITWVVISELFPLHSRARALGLSVATNFALNLIATFVNGPLGEALGGTVLFSFYCVMCAVSIVFVYFFLPETKGKTLEEIDEMMSSNDVLPALAWLLNKKPVQDYKL